MAESDSSDCDIGPALPPHMRAAGRNDRATGPKQSREDPDDAIGPALPPHLRRSQNSEDPTSTTEDTIGPALPPAPAMKKCDGRTSESSGQLGPALPPQLIKTKDSKTRDEEPTKDTRNREASDEEDAAYGPALPPSFTSSKDPSDDQRTGALGPALPPGFRKVTTEDESDDSSDSEGESSDEELIGPMLPTAGDSLRQRTVAEELEARAAAMKDKLTRKVEEVAPSRDSWMTELPEFSKNFGLGTRTFRKNARPDEKDRSGWTDTPADRARKQQERMEKAAAEMRAPSSSKEKKKKERREEKQLSERDKRLAKEVAQHNQAARPESLMDMHSKSRKRKLKEEGMTEQERRPFDRETDLQVNRFDEARRKQLLKKSAHLGDKFSHGSEKTYL
ncbi:GPALPP motifs-containing protein 1-like [Patiria miniata]|uniref:DUF3752 domain-containing protein n=1 Tax=Patiria miniata TaxID=46514 RepID=A0A913ZI89_PATMI|nr:GPALPP motifs-containing protein 1-like [Patiria miniata]